MAVTPSASYGLTVRVEIRNRPGMLGKVTSTIGEAGGDIGAVDIVELRKDVIVRDLTINARDDRHGHDVVTALFIPSVFNKKVAPAVAREVVKAAHKAGVARRERRPASH